MSAEEQSAFLSAIRAAGDRGGCEADDLLAFVLPLMRRVQGVHAEGRVAPLQGHTALTIDSEGAVTFDAARCGPPKKNTARVEQIQTPVSQGLEVVGSSERTSDVDAASVQVVNLEVGGPGAEISRPVFLPGYVAWEHAVGHHDELTDVFSLGLIMASLACGLDLTDLEDVESFAAHRENLFGLNQRLHPVVASVIAQMTELNRHRRAQDLAGLIRRLEHYREQASDFDTGLASLKGFQESNLGGKRRLIQAHLRDRLFEISRRNRLIYFRSTLQTLNLTVASVPLLVDIRNIRLEQLFTWHPELAAAIIEGAPLSLGKYLRFEDAPYIPGVLDKIISEARRDRAEYGFAQLRLVVCFLRWNNLKEAPDERIHSPLLLLPVELTKKKGVRDNYVLDPTTSEAEVNPALRHHLKQLYNLDLPEAIDLRETPLDQFHAQLQTQIQSSEPGVTLRKIDRPQIELIHERARQRVDQYRRRMKLRARPARRAAPVDYSYDRQDFRPLGLQLFLQKVRPQPLPMREVAGAPPQVRLPHAVDSAAAPASLAGTAPTMQTERQMFALRDEGQANPYAWDFDLCSLTLGNFNYRKMTLVRDYANLIETDLGSGAFDTVFSLAPRSTEEAPPPALGLADQFLVVACDATQASAIARARTGRSYIIQGPPGTGKSQTITNLIADYVARGKRVLFVCEKRAAIDVVFHRLRQQGLDELCCLIHDSQTDKKAFIQNLKQTYEKLLGFAGQEDSSDTLRAATLNLMEQDFAALRRFSEAMRRRHDGAGLSLRSLLHRLVELRSAAPRELTAREEEWIPDYELWLRHGEVVNRLAATLADLGADRCFARHPLKLLSPDLVQAERPLELLETELDKAESMLDSVETALDLSGLPEDLWDTFEEVHVLLSFAMQALPLAEAGLVGLLDPQSEVSNKFAALVASIEEKRRSWQQAVTKTVNWKDKLSSDDAQNALAEAQGYEKSLFRFLSPGFWRLKKVLAHRYDFGRHAVPPSRVKILRELVAEHAAEAELKETEERARRELGLADWAAFSQRVTELRSSPDRTHPSIVALCKRLTASVSGPELIKNLAQVRESFASFEHTLGVLLAEYQEMNFPELTDALGKLREQAGVLPDLLPVLCDLAEAPQLFSRALRRLPFTPEQFEAALGRKSLNGIYRGDRSLQRFTGPVLAQRVARLEQHYGEWLDRNAACIRAGVRRRFLEHVRVSSLPAAQLSAEQKIFKKAYAAGRRELEHEFGKTMRYKSIRDLAADDSGRVIQDLKPIWLMSPLSVSDTLPLDPNLFDVVIFDEASQIPLEEAIPAIYRSHQAIVVGDEMQLPPTTFFSAARGEDDAVVVEEEGERIEVDLDADSFLTQSAQNLPSTLLAWHYRSRYESLISFSNAAFYSGNLFTIPDRQMPVSDMTELRFNAAEQAPANTDAMLARSISFHFQEGGIYAERRNAGEAAYIAELVRELLRRETRLSIGIVAFSEAQQGEIEDALSRLAEADPDFAQRFEAETTREENDQFCGLIVKNLENVQGDERDIIILSICYGYDAGRRMVMNFGPINQRGGEKRLNVIFSRSKHHMAIVSSIRHSDITNDYNDGANSLKNFLRYAEAVSRGDHGAARHVVENLNPLARKALGSDPAVDAVIEQLRAALKGRGHAVDTRVGQSKFRCDLAVRAAQQGFYVLGVIVDTDERSANPDLQELYLFQPSILRAFGWRFALVLTKDWYEDPEGVLDRLERQLKAPSGESPEPAPELEEVEPTLVPPPTVATVHFPSVPSQNSGDGPSPPATSPGVQQRPLEPKAAAQSTESTKVARTEPDPRPASGGASPSSPGATRRYLEFRSGASNKFWEISIDGATFTVRFGRIGTPGQTLSKSFADAAKASLEAERLIAEKLRKGYVEEFT